MKLSISLFLAVATAFSFVGSAEAQLFDPVAVSFSGANVGDAIYGPVPGDTTATFTIDGGLGVGGYHYAEQGFYADDPTYGLPATAMIVSASNTLTKIATFQLQGSNSTNVIKDDGTITLSTPATFSNLSFLLNRVNNGAVASFTLNFADGSTTTLNTAGAIPFFASNDASASGGTTAGTFQTLSTNGGAGQDGTSISFFEYDFLLAPLDSTKTLDSITVGANGGDLRTYALSGTMAVTEPGTYAMLFAGVGLLIFFGRLRRKLDI